MAKTNVYSWRLSSELKLELERQARREGVSIADLLERLAKEWLAVRSSGTLDDGEQRRLRNALRACVGTVASGDASGSENVRARVPARLARKRDAS